MSKKRDEGSIIMARVNKLISKAIRIAAKIIRFFLPTMSASAPEGTSANTIDRAQMTLRIENCSKVSPKSRNSIVNTG
jgi:hypothetical protein